MKFFLAPEREITEFENSMECPFELCIYERACWGEEMDRYYVRFENGEIMTGGCLLTDHGNGNTIDSAIMDYCIRISNKRMAFNSYTPQRKEIEIPKLIHTKFLYK